RRWIGLSKSGQRNRGRGDQKQATHKQRRRSTPIRARRRRFWNRRAIGFHAFIFASKLVCVLRSRFPAAPAAVKADSVTAPRKAPGALGCPRPERGPLT